LVEISELVQGFHGIGESVRAKKNRRVAGGFWRFVAFLVLTQKSLYRRRRLRTKSKQKKISRNSSAAM
jgi:hypothetical protein